jgi:hypothetical protein
VSVRRIAANIAKLPEPRRSTHDDRLRENLKSIILIYAARTRRANKHAKSYGVHLAMISRL